MPLRENGKSSASLGQLRVRAAGAADVPAILTFYRSLSPESLLMRFFIGTADDPGLERAAHVASTDTSLVLIALQGEGDQETVVAEARYELSNDGAYEFGLAVLDSHQHQGLGSTLFERLRQSARDRGIRSLRALVRTDNIPMLRMLLTVGCAIVEAAQAGEVTVEVSTQYGMPGWPDRGGRPRVLVESRSWWETAEVAELRRAGYEVRQCQGPNVRAGRPCPLLLSGDCRLVEDADVVACLLPRSDADCTGVVEAHVQQRPNRLIKTVGTSLLAQVQEVLRRNT